SLQVSTANDTQLHKYQVVDGQLQAPQRPILSNYATDGFEPDQEKKPLQKAVDNFIGMISSSKKTDMPEPGLGIQQNQPHAGIWMSQQITSEPLGLTVADLTGNQKLEIAIALAGEVVVAQLNDQHEYTQLAALDLPKNLKILGIDSADLNGDGKSELYLSAVDKYLPQSFVVDLIDGELHISIRNVPWLLRTISLSDQNQTLAGQRWDSKEGTFTDKPFLVIRNGNKLETGQPLSLPDQINIFSIASLGGEQNSRLYTYLTDDDYLKVRTDQGTELWESADYFGGSEIFLEQSPQYSSDPLNKFYYIQPRILTTEKGQLLIPQNEGWRTLERFRMFKASRIISMTWNGFALEENWRTTTQQGYLVDFNYVDADNDGQKELLMLVKFKHKGVLNAPRSALVLYELN
ncbi:VCBS repeat-containing protein, partial [Malonomonas rubra]|uniref:FG-GAP repeat domain-containing protein n=1 Tax=Malonomonas rubra TaxID=57040 RepID=UPI0026ECF966